MAGPARTTDQEEEKSMTEMMLSERIKQDGIEIEYDGPFGQLPTGQYQWKVCLKRGSQQFRLPDTYDCPGYSEPTAFDVLDSVVGTCILVEQSPDWRSWQGEYMIARPGTAEWDERDATYPKVTYDTWVSINQDLRTFLGTDLHEAYLYETDRSE
jgi:hypothetical protein